MVVAVVGLAVIGLPEVAERSGSTRSSLVVLAPLAVSVMAVPPGVQLVADGDMETEGKN